VARGGSVVVYFSEVAVLSSEAAHTTLLGQAWPTGYGNPLFIILIAYFTFYMNPTLQPEW